MSEIQKLKKENKNLKDELKIQGRTFALIVSYTIDLIDRHDALKKKMRLMRKKK